MKTILLKFSGPLQSYGTSSHFQMISPGYLEPPVRVFGATVPEKGSHKFRCS